MPDSSVFIPSYNFSVSCSLEQRDDIEITICRPQVPQNALSNTAEVPPAEKAGRAKAVRLHAGGRKGGSGGSC